MEPGGADAFHGHLVVHFICVAGDAHGANHFAVFVKDQLRAPSRKMGPSESCSRLSMNFGLSR
jgi:hypothetical protein